MFMILTQVVLEKRPLNGCLFVFIDENWLFVFLSLSAWRWRWALVSPDGVVPSWMVGVLIFSCTIESRSSLLAPAHPGGPGKRAVNGCGGGGDMSDACAVTAVCLLSGRPWMLVGLRCVFTASLRIGRLSSTRHPLNSIRG